MSSGIPRIRITNGLAGRIRVQVFIEYEGSFEIPRMGSLEINDGDLKKEIMIHVMPVGD